MHLDRGAPTRFASDMASDLQRQSVDPPPPLGSWSRTYAATILLAIVVIVLLWLLTAQCNVPIQGAR